MWRLKRNRLSNCALTCAYCVAPIAAYTHFSFHDRYTVACESSRNLERGNVELETTIRRSGGARRTVAILLLAASLMLLLLDWLSG
jgi:hypothetical protein